MFCRILGGLGSGRRALGGPDLWFGFFGFFWFIVLWNILVPTSLNDCKESMSLERAGATGPGFCEGEGSTGSLRSIKSVLKSNAVGVGGV